MLTRGIHHVAIKAKDFDKSVKFYTEGLGFKIAIQWGEPGKRACMLDAGESDHIEIFEGRTNEADSDGHFMHLAFKTDNTDECFNRAVSTGGVAKTAPFNTDIKGNHVWKTRLAFVKGPDGEILEFFQIIG